MTPFSSTCDDSEGCLAEIAYRDTLNTCAGAAVVQIVEIKDMDILSLIEALACPDLSSHRKGVACPCLTEGSTLAVPCGITVLAGTISALAKALPGVALLVPVAFSRTPCNEGIYSELVLGLVEYFLGKGDFSIGIALITKTAHEVAGIAVAEAVNSTAVGQVVLNTCAEIAVEINC